MCQNSSCFSCCFQFQVAALVGSRGRTFASKATLKLRNQLLSTDAFMWAINEADNCVHVSGGIALVYRRVSHGGQPTPCFFSQQNSLKAIFTLPVVNDNEIVRSTFDGVEGKSGLTFVPNFWLFLTMGRNKMALAGHPRPCETRL